MVKKGNKRVEGEDEEPEENGIVIEGEKNWGKKVGKFCLFVIYVIFFTVFAKPLIW